MTGPFPGVDPWLEKPETFGDVHGTPISTTREELIARLRPHDIARSAKRVVLERASQGWTEE